MAVRENPFPFPVRCLSDLPESFQEALHPLMEPDDPVHSILLLPPQPFLKTGGIPRQALLTTRRGILHVRDGHRPVATYLPAENLLYTRQTLILLYGGLELVGEVDGQRVQILAEFNTVGQYLLDAALRHFLQLSYCGVNAEGPFPDKNKYLLEKLGDQSFKFMNGLRLYAMQPGEQLLDYVFQARVNERFLRLITHQVVPAALFALTDKAVILIEENKVRGSSYGWVVTLCPRHVVWSVENEPIKKWEKLCIHLLRDRVSEKRNLLLEADTALACKSLWAGQNASEVRANETAHALDK